MKIADICERAGEYEDVRSFFNPCRFSSSLECSIGPFAQSRDSRFSHEQGRKNESRIGFRIFVGWLALAFFQGL